ncbi:MAG TPA: c-type cytochrome, partial [Phototrophicaceae bacterium]|nr:c-type cytochrome [Phototrophicaceae bacterium]
MILVGCSGLAGEPQIIATVPPSTAVPTQLPDTGFPQSPPDLVNGAAIFAQRCVSCHGVDGRGDGELVKSGQVTDPGNFRDPA